MIEQHIDEIKKLQSFGYTTMEIAKKLGIHPPSLYTYFHDHRDVFPKQRTNYRRISDEESFDIYTEYIDEGLTQKEIAMRHGIAQKTVHDHIIKQIKRHSS